MDLSLDVEPVASSLPDVDAVLENPRLRPVGLVLGAALVGLGAVASIAPVAPFWGVVVASVFAFAGVPVFCLGLAAPEPRDEGSPFRLGVDLSATQRRIVASGAGLLLAAPVVAALVGVPAGFSSVMWMASAVVALAGAALVLTGFVAWTSEALAYDRVGGR